MDYRLTKEQEYFFSENYNLVYSLLNKYKNKVSVNDVDDLKQLIHIAMIKSIKTFDSNKGKFSSYVYKITDNMVNDFLKSEIPNSNHLNIDKQSYKLEVDYIKSKNIELIVRNTKLKFKQKYQRIIDLFIDGYNGVEISRLTGFSRSFVNKIIKEYKEKLIKELDAS